MSPQTGLNGAKAWKNQLSSRSSSWEILDSFLNLPLDSTVFLSPTNPPFVSQGIRQLKYTEGPFLYLGRGFYRTSLNYFLESVLLFFLNPHKDVNLSKLRHPAAWAVYASVPC